MSSIQLQSLLSTTEKISAQLAKIKQDVQKQLTSSSYPDVSPISYIERAISLRQSFRQIAEGIQAKRNQAQLQKQKIERSKNFYEGLQYYKATLINKIKQSQIDVVDLQQYFDLPLQVNDWVNDFDQIQSHLCQELSLKQRKSQEYQNLIKLKAEKEENRKSKTNLYQKVIPQKAKKIYEEVMSAANLLDCKELEPISGIVSFKLSLLHEKISNLRLNNTISVSLSQEGIEQLEITILKNDFQLYKKLSQNGIVIKQPETKLIVTSLPGDRLVIGLDRRQDFSNQQVFQRLIHNQLIRSVFQNPKNQNERNINAKYVCVDWLQNSLLNGLLSPLDMINAIKQRVFNLTLAQHIIQNIKKLSFYQVPLCSDRSKYQFEKVDVPIIKKSISSATFQKIKFEEYLAEVGVPEWVDSYRATYDQISKENKRKGLNSETRSQSLQNFIEILQVLNLNELIQSNLNNYYKGTFTIQQNKIDYILIVPFTYPHKQSIIRITNWRGKKEDERKCFTPPTGAKIIKINQPPQNFRQSAYTSYECVVNSQKFQLPEQFKSYQFLLQINFLITLLHYQVDRKQSNL